MRNVFVKGMGIGLVAGAVATALCLPVDRKKVMKSRAGKTIKTISAVIDGLSDTFM